MKLRVALTGGVGSGKSALGSELASLGAVRLDADVLAREVVAAGSPGFDAVVERFGPAVVAVDGELDRPALAALVFSDAAARADLNSIIHPLVGRRSNELMAAAPAGAVIVYEIPLLAETGRTEDFDVVVVVEADLQVRLRRLAERGLDEASARARIGAQATDAERRAIADIVVSNNGTPADVQAAAVGLWEDLRRRRTGERA